MNNEKEKLLINVLNEFNNKIKTMVINIEEQNSENQEIYRLRQRLCLAISADDTIIATHLGPILWNHREEIKLRDEKYFLDFKIELNENNKKLDIKFIVDVIKQHYFTLNKEEKDDMYENIKQLLILYARYMHISKS